MAMSDELNMFIKPQPLTQIADVVVVGAGPAGIAAATAASRCGRSVLVIDDNPAPGGQIWRQGLPSQRKFDADGVTRDRAVEQMLAAGVRVASGCRVIDAPDRATLRAYREEDGAVLHVLYGKLILATGARERFLPFPGWTLPGVFGAGGLQALVKGGYEVAGKRVVVAGTGPLLLAVAAHLHDYGAKVVAMAEQAPAWKLAAFSATMLTNPSKLMQGAGYRGRVIGTPYQAGTWPMAAIAGEGGLLRAVKLSNGKKTWEVACDMLACGFHLVPNTELAALLGCELRGDFVKVDANQQTSQQGIYCAGEPTGIGGLDAALAEGEIAGLAAAGQPTTHLQKRAEAGRKFAAGLERTFALRPELRTLAAPDTVFCRCEDVQTASLAGHHSWTEAKLQTRCGMGPCQGRICGPAAEVVFGWKNASVRQPIFPTPVGALCSNDSIEENA
ncbi:oxidoreductase [Silvibacterium dinghuense]|nr:oxidoreductase [Silvibacterium dinghuense]